jgi:glycosyltransferase involved in cell wall biosynthesis
MDWIAARQAGPAVIRFGLSLVQVQAGGKLREFPPPIHLPGILVFSEELFEGYQKQYGTPASEIILSSGRVDYEYFERMSQNTAVEPPLLFKTSSPRILAVSRLYSLKEKSILTLLEEVEKAAQEQPLQLRIIGDGPSRSLLEERGRDVVERTGGKADIEFLGGFRVQPGHLKQADFVIGQGRSVIEAVACGVPAAVCGNSGYYGLLTPHTLPILAKTNLTGRNIELRGNLLHDLQRLERHKQEDFTHMRKISAEIYDAGAGAKALDSVLAQIEAKFRTKQGLRQQSFKAYGKDLTSWVRRGMSKLFKPRHRVSASSLSPDQV